jgi:cardiolipin synthase
MNDTKKSTLLVDGVKAFEEILNCIDTAQSSILINMFIWREDDIGIRLASAVLRAAERGVKVDISVDRVGMVLERSEEKGRSFFHRAPGISEWFKIAVLRASYPKNCGKTEKACLCEGLLEQILSHPNITVDKDRKKSDHSKYYIFDDKVLIFGGINVEDKECGADCAGRIYQDYMLKLEGEEYVSAFADKRERNLNTADGYFFRMNNKTLSPAVFEMKESFLSVINGAERELVIVMAYFAPIPEIVDAIVAAWKRGVRISIMIPSQANFQNDSNRKTVSTIMKRCNNGVQVFLSPKMVHTKLISSEKTTMFGSCNITNLAFTLLGELDIELKNEDTPLISHIKESVAENLALAEKICDYREIRYSHPIAWLEGRFN